MNVVAESVLARKANRQISEIVAIRSTKKVLKASVSSLIAEGSDNGIVEPKMQWQAIPIVTAASNNHLSLPLLASQGLATHHGCEHFGHCASSGRWIRWFQTSFSKTV